MATCALRRAPATTNRRDMQVVIGSETTTAGALIDQANARAGERFPHNPVAQEAFVSGSLEECLIQACVALHFAQTRRAA